MPTTRKRKHAHSESPEPQIDESTLMDGQNELPAELQIWESFREEYIETIDQLPLSLHRSFTLLRQFDTQSYDQMSLLLPALRQYIKYRKTKQDASTDPGPLWSQVDAWSKLKDISTYVNEYARAAEEKVNLAQSSYDSVDRHIRLLDQAIKEQEQQMRQGNSFEMVQEHNDEIQAIQARVKRNGFMPKNDRLVLSATSTSSGANLTGLAFKNTGTNNTEEDYLLTANSSAYPLIAEFDTPFVRDMPIDPHEPRYCYCNGVSWGEMIACDGGCEREWFHLGCVGLTSAPKGKGKWYCDVCKENFVAGARKKGH